MSRSANMTEVRREVRFLGDTTINTIGRSPRASPKRMKERVTIITRFDINRLLIQAVGLMF